MFNELAENEISNVELGYALIEQHQKNKKGNFKHNKKFPCWFLNNLFIYN
jgi:hypothetical protein